MAQYELDSRPIYTPYVAYREYKKGKNGLKELRTYIKRYYSMIDAEIYFCNEYVEDIMSIDWQILQQTLPSYGYTSYVYDEISQGGRIIYGNFTINFTSPNYLFRLLDNIEAGEETFLSNYSVAQKQRIENIYSAGTKFNETSVKNNFEVSGALWTKTFDIDAIFGYKSDAYSDPVHILLEGVKIMNSRIGASADGGGRPNILEIYSFVARDIILDEYSEEVVETVNLTTPQVSENTNSIANFVLGDSSVDSVDVSADDDLEAENFSDDSPSWADFQKLNDNDAMKTELGERDYNSSLAKGLGKEYYDEVRDILEGEAGNPAIKLWTLYEDAIPIFDIHWNGNDSTDAVFRSDLGIMLNIDKVKDGDPSKNPYEVLFHEVSHAIDFYNQDIMSGKTFSVAYEDGKFAKAIKSDVSNLLKTRTPEQLAIEIQGSGDMKEWALLGDIVGGATGQPQLYGYGHNENYWISNEDYLSHEAFANFMEASINNKPSLNMLKKYLPTAGEIFNEMTEQILKKKGLQ